MQEVFLIMTICMIVLLCDVIIGIMLYTYLYALTAGITPSSDGIE